MLSEYERELLKEILVETEKMMGKPENRKPCPHEKLQPIYDSTRRIDVIARLILSLDERIPPPERKPLEF